MTYFFKPQFSSLSNGNNSIYLKELLRKYNEMLNAKCLGGQSCAFSKCSVNDCHIWSGTVTNGGGIEVVFVVR